MTLLGSGYQPSNIRTQFFSESKKLGRSDSIDANPVSQCRDEYFSGCARDGRSNRRTPEMHGGFERLNATFRAHLCCLVRRVRALAAKPSRLAAGMYLLGTVYNFCTPHQSLRQKDAHGKCKWAERTPAMAASITDHCWRVSELDSDW